LNAGFGEASPEAKAANNLHNFFTYIAVRIVTAQLQVPLFPFFFFFLISLLLLHIQLILCMLHSLVELNLRVLLSMFSLPAN